MLALMFQPFRRCLDFRGRARRTEYWLFVLLQLVILLSALVMGVNLLPHDSLGAGLLGLPLAYLAVFGLPMVALQVRRLHDQDMSGWWALLGAIPYLGGGIVLFMMARSGTWGPNRFGPDPRHDWDGDLFE